MTDTTYRVWFEVDDDCWFAQSPEHPVISAFGDTPVAALHELMIALGQQEPGPMAPDDGREARRRWSR